MRGRCGWRDPGGPRRGRARASPPGSTERLEEDRHALGFSRYEYFQYLLFRRYEAVAKEGAAFDRPVGRGGSSPGTTSGRTPPREGQSVGLRTRHYCGNVMLMPIAQSRLTSQGQVSIPAEIRRRLGLGPGSVIDWEETPDGIVVRRAGRYSFADMRAALFPNGPGRPRSLDELKAGIRAHVRRRHARR